MTGRDGGAPTPHDVAVLWPQDLLEVALLVVDRAESSQRIARGIVDRYLSEEERPPSCLVLAIAQTAGRGRRGRLWVSEPGRGLWASLVAGVRAEDLASIPMRAAIALAGLLEELGAPVGLKWPNDVLLEGRKLGGILVDVVGRGESRQAWTIIGFGINLELPEQAMGGLAPAALGEAPGTVLPPLGELAARCVRALRSELADGRGDWIERYRRLAVHRIGDVLRCELDGERIEGRFGGFDDEGFLCLETEHGDRRLSSGEVFAW